MCGTLRVTSGFLCLFGSGSCEVELVLSSKPSSPLFSIPLLEANGTVVLFEAAEEGNLKKALFCTNTSSLREVAALEATDIKDG